MKKRFLVLILALAMLLTSGCMRMAKTSYKPSQSYSEIIGIEVVDVQFSGIGSDHGDNFETIVAIEEDMWEQFLTDLKEVEYYRYFMDPVYSVSENAFCIYYSDDSFELIDNTSVYYYDSEENDGDYSNCFFDSEQFAELLEKYLSLS